ncbi:MAG: hypothetical protein R3C97_13595 [Geminicoccaceae bacterium]
MMRQDGAVPHRELDAAEIADWMDGVLREHEGEPDRLDAWLPCRSCRTIRRRQSRLSRRWPLACAWFGGWKVPGDISI